MGIPRNTWEFIIDRVCNVKDIFVILSTFRLKSVVRNGEFDVFKDRFILVRNITSGKRRYRGDCDITDCG